VRGCWLQHLEYGRLTYTLRGKHRSYATQAIVDEERAWKQWESFKRFNINYLQGFSVQNAAK